MAKRTSSTPMNKPADILRSVYGGFLPTELKILVHLSECRSEDSPGDCTAVCLQFPVSAKAESSEGAIVGALWNLLDYLAACESEKAFAMCWADNVLQVAFDYGEELPADGFIDARMTEALRSHLSDSSTGIRLGVRDIRHRQERGQTVSELFGQFALAVENAA